MQNHADMLIAYIKYSDMYYYLRIANVIIIISITLWFGYNIGNWKHKKKNDV